MREKIKQSIIIPVYYYEDENGYIVIDKESMTDHFNTKMENLYKSTKKGQHEEFNKKYK